MSDGTQHSVVRRFTLGGPTNLLPKSPYDLYRNGQAKRNLQVIAGVTKHDSSFAIAGMHATFCRLISKYI